MKLLEKKEIIENAFEVSKNIIYVGQLKNTENKKIESAIIGNKLYIKAEFDNNQEVK